MTASAEPATRRLLALDHNFPQPIVEVLVDVFEPDADLVPIGDIDARMPDLEDWQVLLALYHHDRAFDGLVTTDSGMVQLPRELAVLMQTKLTLIVTLAAGHDPIKATGLLFSHLAGICNRIQGDVAQLWTPSAVSRAHTDPWDTLKSVAEHQHREHHALFDQVKLTSKELATDPL